MYANVVDRFLAAVVVRAGGEVTLSSADLARSFGLDWDLVDVADGTGIRVRASVSNEEDDQ